MTIDTEKLSTLTTNAVNPRDNLAIAATNGGSVMLRVTAFKALGNYDIPGRCGVLTGPYPFDCSAKRAVGQFVDVSGLVFHVLGVENHTMRKPRKPLKKGDPVGLLVAPVTLGESIVKVVLGA